VVGMRTFLTVHERPPVAAGGRAPITIA
jgi:hypothetical protein